MLLVYKNNTDTNKQKLFLNLVEGRGSWVEGRVSRGEAVEGVEGFFEIPPFERIFLAVMACPMNKVTVTRLEGLTSYMNTSGEYMVIPLDPQPPRPTTPRPTTPSTHNPIHLHRRRGGAPMVATRGPQYACTIHVGQQAWDIKPMLGSCWASVRDVCSTLLQHWLNVHPGMMM